MRFIAHTTNPLDGDSVAGVLGAIKAGFAGADVNVHSTADGVIVALHWAAGGGWPLYPRADALTFAQCQARRNRKRTSARIPNITELLDAAEKADPGFVLCLEAKPSPGLEDPKVWRQVAGRNAIAMVIQRFRTATWEKAAIRRMAAAKAAASPRCCCGVTTSPPTLRGGVSSTQSRVRLTHRSSPRTSSAFPLAE